MSEEQNIKSENDGEREPGKKIDKEQNPATLQPMNEQPPAAESAAALEDTGQPKQIDLAPVQESENPEILAMEVHKHPHHLTHKKKWTEYLLEFLMLFLAVFLGFIAENIREHYVEHQREKQFAKQLLNDLRKDSTFFDSQQKRFDSVFEKDKMISHLLAQPGLSDKNLLEGFIRVFRSFDVNLTNTTFSQMKSSGSLRYIRNTALTAELQNYYDVMSQRVITEGNVAKDFLKDYLLPFFLKHVKAQDLGSMQESVTSNNPVMLGRSPETDQELINITDMYRIVNLGIGESTNQPTAKQAHALIAIIKKEYKLE